MAIYTGIDGVVREVNSLEVGKDSVVRHCHSWKAGIDEVARDLIDITPQINNILVVPKEVIVYTRIPGDDLSYDELIYEGSGLEEVNKYGELLITDNSVQVTCNKANKRIELISYIFVELKDGHRILLYDLASNSQVNSFSLKVRGFESFSDDGWYVNECLGNSVMDYHVSGSSDKTVILTSATQEYSLLVASMRDSGVCSSVQTFYSSYINGQEFKVKIKSEL